MSRRPGARAAWGACVTLAALAGCGDARDDRLGEARLSLTETLAGADTLGYERAVAPRRFTFPEDHGPHPDFRTEWWYVTGNLATAEGRRFGFQFTIFRSALAPELDAAPVSAGGPGRRSAWSTRQAYMAHFTLTDVESERFQAHERFARGAAGLAGAEAGPPWRVWLDTWSLEEVVDEVAADGRYASAVPGLPIRLRAAEGPVALDLELGAMKPAVLQGEAGLSQKGAERGNASYYYALTRMPARGTVVLDGRSHAVEGLAWMDREWSTSALSDDQVGWDWFALQLGDGWDLMVYQLRLADGSPDPLSDGSLVSPAGDKVRLRWGEDVLLEPTGTWASPIDAAVYPSGWRLRVPSRGWDLRVEPVMPDQELDLAFRYWEGAVRVTGTGEGGRAVEGRGYVELTGYAGEARER